MARASFSNFFRDKSRADLVRVRERRLDVTMETVRPIVPHQPSLRQREFLALDAEEACFGGAAGGGKTDCAVIGALQYIDVPEYSAVIFRRHETDFALPGSVLDLTRKWITASGYPAHWDAKLHGYRFPSGATLHFGFAQTHTQLVAKYQGSFFQYIAFDELTQWVEPMYQYMFSRLRRLERTVVPLRMRAFTNPGGTGHAWVKRRFVTNARQITTGSDAREDIKAYRNGKALPVPAVYVSPPSPEAEILARDSGVTPQGAYFVPAFLKDNPGLDIPSYERQLLRLDPVTRAQLKNGDWDVISSGNFFKAEWFKILPQAPAGLRWLRSWDQAATEVAKGKNPDWTAGPKQGIERMADGNRRLIIGDLMHFRESPGTTQQRMKATAVKDGKHVPILLEQEPGSAGKTLVHNFKTGLFFGWMTHSTTRTGSKEDYWKQVSPIAEAGNMYLVDAPWNLALIEELTGLPHGHDDIADAISLGFAWATGEGSGAERTRMLTSG